MKIAGFLEKFIAAYGTGLFWVNKSIIAGDVVKFVFLCPSADLNNLTKKVSSEIEGLGLKVFSKVLSSELSFIRATNWWLQDKIIFLAKGGKVAILGRTELKSRGRRGILFLSVIPFWFMVTLIAYFVVDLIVPPKILFFGMLGSILVMFFLHYHLCVKHSEPVIITVRKTLEEVFSCRFRYGGNFPYKFPWTTYYEEDEFLKHVFEKRK